MPPNVSVVIPAYNAMSYLPETVESVLRQTYTDFEVLIIDDGSSDNTGQWVSQVSDPRVHLISQKNQGLAGANNTGIAHAQGKYIAFLDADDLWKSTKLEKQVYCLKNDSAVGLVYTWPLLVDYKGRSTGRLFASHAEGEVWKQLVESNIVGCGSVPLVRRCCFETVGVFDRNLSLAPDWDLWLRIARRYPFAVIKEPLVLYRQHPNNLSKNWQVYLQDAGIILEKAFYSVPSELLYLKDRGYSSANLFVAWKCLQSCDKDYKRAIYFRQKALIHYPHKRYSWEYIRLSLAIALMQWFGPHGYKRVIVLIHALRRCTSSIT